MGESLRGQIESIFKTAVKPYDALWLWAKDPDKESDRHERWKALATWASAQRKKQDPKSQARAAWAERQGIYEGKIAATHGGSLDVVPGIVDGWHPDATRVQVQAGIGAFLSCPAKLVWHTTEGSGLPTYSGSAPHFTLDPKTGKLYQHIPITSGAMSLVNASGGVETNRAHAIQVELMGFAAQTEDWPLAYYENVAKLARWIEAHAGVKRSCGVTFSNVPHRLSGPAWISYAGHCGHQHVPENEHWDPGTFRIGAVLAN